MSWSAERQSSRENEEAMNRKKRETLQNVNSVLRMLANDEDFHDDLKQPLVKIAIKHWTGEARLPPGYSVSTIIFCGVYYFYYFNQKKQED